ncbi:MAG: phosphate acyltransferase PlsX [Gammaproteobacteria bacterium]|nr:phosphate acyltransferase PlsX [Gammaproteobacteria bacterium]
MGGDHGPSVTVPAVKLALDHHPELKIILVGLPDRLSAYLKRSQLEGHPRLTIHPASEVIGMDESPTVALRSKKDSSMRVAINLVKDQVASACVSAGNTGALMAISYFVLKTLPGIDRPAILYSLPTLNPDTHQVGKVHMLDLGANVECSAQHLFQFAVMGSVLSHSIDGVGSPRIALLNIGEEEMKGLEVIKQAAQLIQHSEALNYVGYVEGTDILRGKADVIVCDGFIGNIALKTIEGVVKYIGYHVKKAIRHNWWTRLCSFFALPVFLRIRKTLDLRRYNGASLLGLRGIVIKSHGSAEAEAFSTAISEAVFHVEKDIPNQICTQLADILGEDHAS